MTAFRASYADLKLIKTRQTVQIIFEIPQADFDAAYEVLGGLPNPAAERWFGIAAIRTEVMPDTQRSNSKQASDTRPQPVDQPRLAGAKRDWRDLQPSQQAGIRCQERSFVRFLEEEHPNDLREAGAVPDCVRMICGVESRTDLNTNQKARVIWHQLNDKFEAWLMVAV